MTTKKQIRDDFKAIGYKCQILKNPLKDDLLSLGFIADGVSTTKSNVFPDGFYEKHKKAFDLQAQHRGTTLESGERIAK